jgi:hypothetical protein
MLFIDAVGVCTENLILVDYVTESPNVNGDDRAALLLPACRFRELRFVRIDGVALSFPKIISARSDDAIRTRLARLQ